MRAGDVVFVRGNSIVSKAIRFFDKGRFSHVAIAVSDTHVIETNWNMRSKIVEFYYDDYEIVELPLTDEQRVRVIVEAKLLEGIPYDYLQILFLMFASRLNNPRYFICSELVYTILKNVGYLTDTSLRDSTPNEMYGALVKGGEGRCWNRHY